MREGTEKAEGMDEREGRRGIEGMMVLGAMEGMRRIEGSEGTWAMQ